MYKNLFIFMPYNLSFIINKPDYLIQLPCSARYFINPLCIDSNSFCNCSVYFLVLNISS